MKNILIIIALCLLVIVSGSFILESTKVTTETNSESLTTNQSTTNSVSNTNSNTIDDSQIEDINITKDKLNSFSELQIQSDLILEVTGTNIYEEIKANYIAYDLCTVNINEILKGSYDLSDIKVLLDIDVDPLLKENESYLIFLKKVISETNNEYYTPLGYGQGIYKILDSSSDTSNINPSTNSATNSNISNLNNKKILKSNSSTNTLFNELTNDYATIKLLCKK